MDFLTFKLKTTNAYNESANCNWVILVCSGEEYELDEMGGGKLKNGEWREPESGDNEDEDGG
jgi:hypothetical protein